ncbi:MAG: cupin domain-containing protein [Gammaproteobacteria bacterium]|nr:cupin domain-containing protein [Gammaproteobacteria bacterium]
MSAEQFLTEYWQKKPLLIKQAFINFDNPLSADELAGLACEHDVESRIVLEKDGTSPWELRNGPFSEQTFEKLPETHWTLLVQDVEKHIPELTGITDLFNFIPHWRLDDLMISYAPDKGSVGPHVDAYDVFLLQAEGKRCWQISSSAIDTCEIISNIDLKILKQFNPDQDWILEPGDMLYLPPGIPHHGVAMGDCMTYSIGFRAPSHLDILQSFIETIIKNQDCEKLYTDPKLDLQASPHEISLNTIDSFNQIIQQHLDSAKQTISHSVGTLLSEGKIQFQSQKAEETLDEITFIKRWQQKESLFRNTAIKFLYIPSVDHIDLYIDGQHCHFDSNNVELAEWICSTLEYNHSDCNKHNEKQPLCSLLYYFYQQGYCYFQST